MRTEIVVLSAVLIASWASGAAGGDAPGFISTHYRVARKVIPKGQSKTLVLNVSVQETNTDENSLIALSCTLMRDYIGKEQLDELLVGVFKDFKSAKRFVGVHDDLPGAYKDQANQVGQYTFNLQKSENYLTLMPSGRDSKTWKRIDLQSRCGPN